MQMVQHWTYDPSVFDHGFLKTEARILGFSNVGVQNIELTMGIIIELVMEFTGDQMEMVNKMIAETIMGTIMEMIVELTGDWIPD